MHVPLRLQAVHQVVLGTDDFLRNAANAICPVAYSLLGASRHSTPVAANRASIRGIVIILEPRWWREIKSSEGTRSAEKMTSSILVWNIDQAQMELTG